MQVSASRSLFSVITLVLCFASFYAPIQAQTDFDPTQEYTVHSAPILPTTPYPESFAQTTVSGGLPKKAQPNDELSVQLTTKQTSLWDKIVPASLSFIQYSSQALVGLFHKFGSVVARFGAAIAHTFKTNAKEWLIQSGILLLGIIVGSAVVSSPVFQKVLRRVFTAGTDLQVKAVGVLTTLLVVAVTHRAFMEVYQQQLEAFTRFTGWQFAPLGEDLIIVGVMLAIVLVFVEAEAIIAVVKAAAVAAKKVLPARKAVTSYFAKESKTAFSETEKECKDRVDKCSSWFDKGIILLFNYLPGTMPDLGMDDAIINWKNKLLPPSQSKVNDSAAK